MRKAIPSAAFSRAVGGPAGSKNLCMRGISMRENRDIPRSPACGDGRAGRAGKADGRNPVMDDRGKSDDPAVPAKPVNNAQGGAAESVKERGSAEGNAASETRSGLRAGPSAPSELDRVRQAAQKDKEARFTALLHHVDVDRLRAAYWAIRPKAAPGVDGVTWLDYGADLEANLRDLHARVHRGSYRARPSRRVFIPKADGRLRPLGVAALEDKILQRALVEVASLCCCNSRRFRFRWWSVYAAVTSSGMGCSSPAYLILSRAPVQRTLW